MNTVCVIGLGYIGLPTALLLAKEGMTVYGYDIDEKKIAGLQKGQLPFQEPELAAIYQSVAKNFFPVYEPSLADAYIICVPTPVTEQGTCDDSYVRQAAQAIAQLVRQGALVVLESTVAPGTTENVVRPILEKSGLIATKDFFLAIVCEKAIPGQTIHEMIHNSRIIGGMDKESARRAEILYRRFVRGEISLIDCKTAEMVKLVENTYRDVNIAFANELAKVCATVGVNVWEVIRLANKHPRVNVHAPGPGVGGHCIALDPWFLIQQDRAQTKLMQTSREVNESMPAYVSDFVAKLAEKYHTKKIGILGVAYKKNVDDARETPALPIIEALQQKSFQLFVHDPLVKNFTIPLLPLETVRREAEAFVLLTDHDAYKDLVFDSPYHWLLDTRGLYEFRNIGIDYYLLGCNSPYEVTR